MTLFIQVCGVLAVLAIPYAVITIADKAMVKKQRNEARLRERVQTTIESANRTRVVL
jgi:hypothetical protein